MEELFTVLQTTLARLDLRGLLDIIIVALLFYGVLVLMRGTTAVSLLRGIFILVLVGFLISGLFQLSVMGWLMRNSVTALLVAIPIIFQPEIRRALERVGRAGFILWGEMSPLEHVLRVVSAAAAKLARQRVGALVVLGRETGLQEYSDTGITIDAVPSGELLVGIFTPSSPIHDGAVIIRGGRVDAAACLLPISERLDNKELGTRHRAAIGITERTDAIAVVVSEETGRISVAANGRLITVADEDRLLGELSRLYGVSLARRLPRWIGRPD